MIIFFLVGETLKFSFCRSEGTRLRGKLLASSIPVSTASESDISDSALNIVTEYTHPTEFNE